MHVTGLRPRPSDRDPSVRTARPIVQRLTSRPATLSAFLVVRIGAGARHVLRVVGSPLRLVAIALSVAILAAWALDWWQVAQHWQELTAVGLPGRDYSLYLQAASRWLGGGDFYLASQLGGPYSIQTAGGAILYPPTLLILLVPFIALPAVLWWAIPLATIGWAIRVHRPSAPTWPVLALLLWWPTTNLKLLGGNPTTLWFTAALALATLRPAASALFVLKPTLIPFALLGARRAGWWVAIVLIAVVSVPFIDLWVRYVRVLLDARDPSGMLYSLHDVPTMFIPIVVWIGGVRSPLPGREAERVRATRARSPRAAESHRSHPAYPGLPTLDPESGAMVPEMALAK